MNPCQNMVNRKAQHIPDLSTRPMTSTFKKIRSTLPSTASNDSFPPAGSCKSTSHNTSIISSGLKRKAEENVRNYEARKPNKRSSFGWTAVNSGDTDAPDSSLFDKPLSSFGSTAANSANTNAFETSRPSTATKPVQPPIGIREGTKPVEEPFEEVTFEYVRTMPNWATTYRAKHPDCASIATLRCIVLEDSVGYTAIFHLPFWAVVYENSTLLHDTEDEGKMSRLAELISGEKEFLSNASSRPKSNKDGFKNTFPSLTYRNRTRFFNCLAHSLSQSLVQKKIVGLKQMYAKRPVDETIPKDFLTAASTSSRSRGQE